MAIFFSILATAARNGRDLMGAIENLTTWMQLIIQIATVATLIYTLSKFAQKPNQTQDSRLDELEKWRESVELRLDRGENHFSKNDETTRVMIESQLAIMDALTSIPELPAVTKEHLVETRSSIYKSIAKNVSE